MAVKQRSTVPELGDDNNSGLVDTKPTANRLQRVYLGPTINKPYLKNHTVFIGELPDYINDDHKKVIVSLDKMVEFEKRLADKYSVERMYYDKIKGAK